MTTQPTVDPRSFTPPEKFSFQPKEWLLWKKRWEHYRLLSSLQKQTEEFQISALLYSMGDKSDDILSSLRLSDADKVQYDAVFKAFDTHFIGQRNVVYERAVFGSRVQEVGETVESYVTSLHTLSEFCDYGTLREELVRDRIVLGVRDKKLGEKLMLMEKLTLEKAVEVSKQWEHAKCQQQTLQGEGSKSQLDSVKKSKKKPWKNKPSTSSPSTSQDSTEQTSSSKPTSRPIRECRYCGKTHELMKSKCPAVGETCSKCHKEGHFAVKCRRNDKPNPASANRVCSQPEDSFSIGMISSMDEVSRVNSSRSSRWTAQVQVDGKSIDFKLDSGADATAVPLYLFRKLWKKRQISSPDRQLLGPDGSKLPVVGQVSCKMKNNDCEIVEEIFVVRNLERPLLSLRACEDLKLILRLDNVNGKLTQVEPTQEFPELFTGLGKLNTPYSIKLKNNAVPFAMHCPRRVPIPLQENLKKKLNELVQLGVIEPVDEPTDWCAPLVTLPKPNGDIRLCVDLTVLNESVHREYHPMPVVEHTLAQLGSARVFSKLDANSGFYQILLSEESQRLTTFITPFGRYCFRRLPFGITSAPEHFQKRMEEILRDLPGVLLHVDDILIFGATIEEHDARLRAVMKRIRDSGLTLNKEKCIFGVPTIKFLGHFIDENGVKPDPEKVEAIANMPPPTSVTETRRFMGMVNYLGRFVPHVSTTAKPLLDLTRADRDFSWDSPQAEAFKRIKQTLTSEPVLSHYDPSLDTVVSSDASSFGLGAVLLQKQHDGKLKPVAYASRTLTPAETRYAQIEKEALGIVWACERFRDFILGKGILIETDHKPLLQILKTKGLDDLSPRLQRLRIRLMRYQYSLTYVPGKQLITADALSRQPLKGHGDSELEQEVKAYVCHVLSSLPVSDTKLSEIWKQQQADPILKKVASFCSTSWPTDCTEPLLKPYWNVRDSLTLQNGLLLKDCRIVIPSNMREEILGRIHEGHLGIVKCRARARQSCWYPGISVEIAEVVRRCPTCVKERVERKEPLLPSPFPARPWQSLAMDLFKLNGKWFVIIVDFFSRYPEVSEISNLTTAAVVDFLKKVFSRHGIPEEILTDNGTQFHPLNTSPFRTFAQDYGFTHRTSSPLFPQSNGFVENAVKIVKNLFKKNVDLYKALLEYRSTPLTNGYSPGELLMGRRLRSTLPMDPTRLIPNEVDLPKLNEKENLRRDRQKKDFDRHHGVRNKPDFHSGEVVWVKDRRSWGKVLSDSQTPRSFIVETPDGQYRRNSSDLTRAYTSSLPENIFVPDLTGSDLESTAGSPPSPPPANPEPLHQAERPAARHSPATRRPPSGRPIKPPRRLIEEI